MLKRPRAPSPSPASSDIPYLEEFSSLDHSTKRRRVAPPSMEGYLRGVPVPRDDEEYDSCDGSPADELSVHFATPPEMRPQLENSYKNINNLLHQLHLEHQNRSRFIDSSHYGQIPGLSIPASSASQSHDQHNYVPYSAHSLNLNLSDHERRFPIKSTIPLPGHSYNGLTERKSATEIYEHKNRALGNVFLDRRKRRFDHDTPEQVES